MNQMHVEFSIPEPLGMQVGLTPENASDQTRRMLALFLYEHGRISIGKACELGGFSQWEFAEMNRELAIPLTMRQEDLKEDMARLANV
jgi:predicted HTH domain antitoxin